MRALQQYGRRVAVAAVAGVAGMLAACVDSVVEGPSQPLAPSEVRRSVGTVGADIYVGFNKFHGDTTYTIHGEASGGVAPYRYYWYVQRCYAPASPNTAALCTNMVANGGSPVDSIQVYIEPNLKWIRFRLSVGDADMNTSTGFASAGWILGPSAISGSPTQACEPQYPPYGPTYPYTGAPPEPWHETGQFRINPCTQALDWEKTP